jgi:hypothetical protein
VFRLLTLAVLAALAFLLIEARWTRQSLTLTLRVRTGTELAANARGKLRELGERAVHKLANGSGTPDVGAAPPHDEEQGREH